MAKNRIPAYRYGPRGAQQLGPQRRQRQIQHQQQEVADEQARDQRPDQQRLLLEQRRTRLDPVGHERGQHHRRGRVGRQTQRQHRHQRARRRRVVRRLRAGDALDGALAELVLVLGELLLRDVGQERRQFGSAGRQRTERESVGGAAQPRLPRAFPVRLRHPWPPHRDHLERTPPQMRRHPQRLTEGEHRDRDDDQVDAVGELRQPERRTRLAGEEIDADQADRQAEQQRDDATQLGVAEDRGDRDDREQHDRQVRRRTEGDGPARHDRREEHQQQRADRRRRRTNRSPPSPTPAPRGPPAPSCCPRSR